MKKGRCFKPINTLQLHVHSSQRRSVCLTLLAHAPNAWWASIHKVRANLERCHNRELVFEDLLQLKMAIKEVLLIALTLCQVIQWTEAAPSYKREIEDFDNTATFDLAKRLLGEERALRSRLRKIEGIKREMGNPCNAQTETFCGLTCIPRSRTCPYSG